MNHCIVAAALFATTVLAAPGAAEEWRALPLARQVRIHDVAICAADPARVLLWTGILHRSTNSGDAWQVVEARFDRAVTGDALRHLQFDAKNPEAAWCTVGDAVLRSTDFGATWRGWGRRAPGDVITSFLADSHDPASAWIGVLAGPDRGAYRTSDAGMTWRRLGGASFVVGVSALAPDPTDSSLLLATTDQGVARSTDSGDTWTWTRPGPPARELQWSVNGAIVGVLQPDLWRSFDRGVTWESVAPSAWPVAFWSDPENPERVLSLTEVWCPIGGTSFCPSYGYVGYLRETTNDGANWATHVSTGSASFNRSVGGGFEEAPSSLYSWIPHVSGSSRIIQRTTDAGITWAALGAGLSESKPLDLAWDGSGRLWSMDPGGSAQRSTDRGRTWSDIDGPQMNSESPYHRAHLAVHPGRPGHLVWIGVRGSCDAPMYGAFCSTDAGVTWRPDLEGDFWDAYIPFESFNVVFAFGHGTGTSVHVWSGEGANTRHYVSFNGGASYLDFSASEAPIQAIISPRDDWCIYGLFATGEPVRISEDHGFHWSSRSAGLRAQQVVRILVDPNDEDHALAVYASGGPSETWDRGVTWHAYGDPPPGRAIPGERVERVESPWLELHGVTIASADWNPEVFPARLFFGTDRGVWTSDAGFADAGLPSIYIDELSYSPVANALLAVSKEHGAYVLEFDGLRAAALPIALRAGNDLQPLVLSVRPNPVRTHTRIEFTAPQAGPFALSIYDVAGRRVRVLDGESRAGDRVAARWSGDDDAGQPVTSGVYFVRLETSVGRRTIPVRVLR